MGKLDGKIDAVFADMNVPQHPGAALLVIDHDEIVYSKCYGLADLETQRPITTDTSFYLASISKQYTAMAIMLLAEDGRLSHEDRLPAFFPPIPSWGAEISVRHLLHHTSGLPGYVHFFSSSVGIPEWTREINGVTNEAVLELKLSRAGNVIAELKRLSPRPSSTLKEIKRHLHGGTTQLVLGSLKRHSRERVIVAVLGNAANISTTRTVGITVG